MTNASRILTEIPNDNSTSSPEYCTARCTLYAVHPDKLVSAAAAAKSSLESQLGLYCTAALAESYTVGCSECPVYVSLVCM